MTGTAKAAVAGAMIRCSHGGTARLPAGSVKLQVSGNGVVTAGQEVGVSFAPGAPTVVTPCPLQGPSNPSPCTATQAAVSGLSALLQVDGAAVLLDTATGPAVNPSDPAATWSIADAGQSLLNVDR